jgi:hypothetical protein
MDSVHGSWTSAGGGPWWTAHHGRPWRSPELSLAAALGHGSLPRGGEEEGAMGSLFWLVPRLGRRRDGGAPAVELSSKGR